MSTMHDGWISARDALITQLLSEASELRAVNAGLALRNLRLEEGLRDAKFVEGRAAHESTTPS